MLYYVCTQQNQNQNTKMQWIKLKECNDSVTYIIYKQYVWMRFLPLWSNKKLWWYDMNVGSNNKRQLFYVHK